MTVLPIRVAVLGSTGMLGHAVAGYLKRDPHFEVIERSRSTGFDALSPDFHRSLWPSNYEWGEIDYVINCAGVIWQAQNPSRIETFRVNAAFPHCLSQRCRRMGAKLIHVSTDCVFDGASGNYTEDTVPNAQDDYGLSKAAGEPADAMVLRSSIIGTELKSKRSFLEWARSSKGSEVAGYTNHLWNGVTAPEYARICADIIARDLWEAGIHHVFSSPITKYDLLHMLSEHFDLSLRVRSAKADRAVNRTLATVKPLCEMLSIPGTQAMVSAMERGDER